MVGVHSAFVLYHPKFQDAAVNQLFIAETIAGAMSTTAIATIILIAALLASYAALAPPQMILIPCNASATAPIGATIEIRILQTCSVPLLIPWIMV